MEERTQQQRNITALYEHLSEVQKQTPEAGGTEKDFLYLGVQFLTLPKGDAITLLRMNPSGKSLVVATAQTKPDAPEKIFISCGDYKARRRWLRPSNIDLAKEKELGEFSLEEAKGVLEPFVKLPRERIIKMEDVFGPRAAEKLGQMSEIAAAGDVIADVPPPAKDYPTLP